MNYKKLYEKYARAEKSQAIAAIIGGALGVITGIYRLKAVRDDRREAGKS